MFLKSHLTLDKKERILTVLDIGSSKIACFIAKVKPNNSKELGRTSSIEILGYGACKANGIKNGLINDMKAAAVSIKFAVAEAESKANIQIQSILVAINSSHIKNKDICVDMELTSKIVTSETLSNLLKKVSTSSTRTILHRLPIEYKLDESLAVENPIGMVGEKLTAKLQILDINTAALRNIEHCLQCCYLDVESITAAQVASSLAVLLEQEMAMGGICIDIGSYATGCANFIRNKLINAFTIPCGSNYITTDIEHAFNVSFAEAEKLKCKEGFIDLSVNQANLTSVITARAEEILQLIHKNLIKIDKNFIKGKTIVLTGGGSYLGGFTNLAEVIFRTKVRLGRPLGYSNIKSLPNSASYSTALGLLAYPEYVEQNNLNTRVVEQFGSIFGNGFLTFGKKNNKMIC